MTSYTGSGTSFSRQSSPGTDYKWRVQAANAGGNSKWITVSCQSPNYLPY